MHHYHASQYYLIMYSYDILHTCGPDPAVCCQFDFLRLFGHSATCLGGPSPVEIREENVKERSMLLLDQYRKKSQVFRTNVLLVPLGDDFRWDSVREWDNQFNNYQQIFNYINSHPELNTEISWGTLSDYFSEVRKESELGSGDELGLFPSLSGDFFTYADKDDSYWSGYFTSRPLWKHLDRVLEGYLRAAEILFSLSMAEMKMVKANKTEALSSECMQGLQVGRQTLSLFQHHDGITGTAKDNVVIDYGEKMLKSINLLQNIISRSTNFLLSKSKSGYNETHNTTYFDLGILI